MASKTQFDVPPGATAKVSIIDSSFRLANMPMEDLVSPPLEGLGTLPTIPSWSFLVEASSGQKVLFDLGVAKDLDSLASVVAKRIQTSGWDININANVADILNDNGIHPSEINTIIWSHWHWDHIGDITTFPSTTELVVGPGFKDSFYPGYPTKPDCPIRDAYFSGRTLREIEFGNHDISLKAGTFRAFDFFGDGSFYLLDAPGHAIGHLAGLARTTSDPDTFIFMGGDLCHHGGEMRPSPQLPIPPTAQLPLTDSLRHRLTSCPGSTPFQDINVKRGRKADEPFFDPAMGLDIPRAIETVKETQLADAQEDVYFIFAHDMTINGVVDKFPASANEWKQKGWRAKSLWRFLNDFEDAIPLT